MMAIGARIRKRIESPRNMLDITAAAIAGDRAKLI